MSKSNMLLGTAKGKFGDIVFYRVGGEQRHRPLVIPKNPRTRAQMAQRVKIANVSGIYRAAADILRDSFVNRPSNQSGYNAFAARAISQAPFLTREMATAGSVIPQPAMASRGTLPPVLFDLGSSAEYDGLEINLELTTTDTTTVGEVSSAILAQHPWASDGAELHFLLLVFSANPNVGFEVDVYEVEAIHRVFKIDTTSTELLSTSGFEVVGNTFHAADAAPLSGEAVSMGVVIQSRVDGNGRLDTSTQYFDLSGAASTLYAGYRTDAALQQAVASYKAGKEISLR